MTRASVNSFVAAHWIRLLTGAFLLGGMWYALTAAVKGKLDRSEFVDYRSERATLDSAVIRELRTIKVLECRDKPLDSYCVQR